MSAGDSLPPIDTLLAEARTRAGLDDFGSRWFLDPLGVLLEALRTEARLSEAGVAAHRERILAALVNRLRTTEAIKRHPGILEQPAEVAGVIVGLPRTGSTMFHRLLTTAPGLTALRWWEAQNYAPFPGEERGRPDERVAWAERLLASMLEHNPDLMSIHPFQVHGADEEIIILDQCFIGTMPEAYAYIPSFSAWLERADQRPAYEDLRTVLKFLQWQDPARANQRWVLKTPGHLAALDALFAVFPQAQLILMHRDPLQTVPSYCSMVVALHELATAQADRVTVGRFTAQRWAGLLGRLTSFRDSVGEKRFIDVAYEDLVRDPLAQWRRVLARLGEPTGPEAGRAAAQWLADNGRDKRAPHHYTQEEFGLTRAELERWFAPYRSRFIRPSASQ
ncbi:MAG: sulfotransferase [Steroidobacteraceae bacterium]